MTKKRRKRKSKQTGKRRQTSNRKQTGNRKSGRPPMSAKMQELVQAGYQARLFEIADDDAGSNYKRGIRTEIGEATWLVKTGKLDEATTAFQGIIKREPRAKEAYVNLGAIYNKMGDKTAAEALFQETIDKFPRYVFPRANMALIYLQRGEDDKAEAVMRPLDNQEKFTSTEFRMYVLTWCDIHAHQRHFKVALSWLKILPKLLPRSRGLWQRRVFYQFGRIFLEKRGE
ncbi:MAG: tetratricopeptide repeat protein [Chloroflexi bacterium]|nr:tetratricopeptide repeat protein [Chloroflexota bacterium]